MKLTSITTTAFALSALLLASCNKEKSAISDKAQATKAAIDDEKRAVNTAAESATKQADLNAAIDKANVKANKESAQAQLDAEKKKTDAEAEATVFAPATIILGALPRSSSSSSSFCCSPGACEPVKTAGLPPSGDGLRRGEAQPGSTQPELPSPGEEERVSVLRSEPRRRFVMLGMDWDLRRARRTTGAGGHRLGIHEFQS